jgi:hypothetical protein
LPTAAIQHLIYIARSKTMTHFRFNSNSFISLPYQSHQAVTG